MNPSAIEKRIQDYELDGWIGHIGSDGKLEFGDGALRFGQYEGSKFLLAEPAEQQEIRKNYIVKSCQILVRPEPIRHPDKSKWYGQPGCMSKDNLRGLIAGAEITDSIIVNRAIWSLLRENWFFAWNKKGIWSSWKIPVSDWCGPTIWRLLNPNWPYWAKSLCDLITLLDTIFVALLYLIIKSHTSPIQVMVMEFPARKKSPTIFSNVAEFIFLNCLDWKDALKSYFNPKDREYTAPPLDVEIIRALEKITVRGFD